MIVLFLEELAFYLDLLKWVLLIYMAYWLYTWTRDKLGFSQIVVFAVAGILIYYLVIEHPVIGALGIFGWIFLTGGLIYILGMVPSLMFFFRKR